MTYPRIFKTWFFNTQGQDHEVQIELADEDWCRWTSLNQCWYEAIKHYCKFDKTAQSRLEKQLRKARHFHDVHGMKFHYTDEEGKWRSIGCICNYFEVDFEYNAS